MTGLIVGLIRLILTVVYHEPVCSEPDNRPEIVARLHYMYFAVLSFLLTSLVMVVVSLFTRPPEPEKLSRLTYFNAWDVPVETDSPTTVVCAALAAYSAPAGDTVAHYGDYDATVTEQPRCKENDCEEKAENGKYMRSNWCLLPSLSILLGTE